MKRIFMIIILFLSVLFVSCMNQKVQTTAININSQETPPPVEIISKEVIIKEYISDFLTKGYRDHYVINSIESDIIKQSEENNKIEAIVCTNMNNCNPIINPDTVPYIMAAKEKAFKETNPDKKHTLQQEYLTLYGEYLKPFENNFTFKLIAQLKNESIDEASIQLFIETDQNQGVKYEPAEDILPKQ